MMQTPNYKLNKPEMSDPFSPAPLSENMDAIDAALGDHETRVVKLENCRIVAGKYYSGSRRVIDLGERPVAVLSVGRSSDGPFMGFVTGDGTCTSHGSTDLQIVDNGFQVGGHLTSGNAYYCFLAFLGGWPYQEIPED